MKTNKFLYILSIALGLVACEPEFDDVDFNAGSAADFSTFITVGNSLTAGVQSNALSANGQLNSISNIVAQQLKMIGGGEFKQPIIPGEPGEKGAGVVSGLIQGGLLLPELSLIYVTNCANVTSLGPAILPAGNTGPIPNAAYPAAEFLANVAADGPYNNMGISGARLVDLNTPGYASANPHFGRLAASPTETIIESAMKNDASFFLLWIGNNDVLGYSTRGGDEGGAPITDAATFTADYKRVLDSLTKNGAKGVVANIPNVTSIPYFTTIPTGTDAVDAATASLLNAAYGAYNAGLDQVAAAPGSPLSQAEADSRKIVFEGGKLNSFVVIDPTLTDVTAFNPALINMRQSKPGELMILAPGLTDSLTCAQWGTAKPIPGNFHINASELTKINDAVSAYNASIKSEANSRGLAMFDANSRLKQLASEDGITISGINFTSSFITGGAFSSRWSAPFYKRICNYC